MLQEDKLAMIRWRAVKPIRHLVLGGLVVLLGSCVQTPKRSSQSPQAPINLPKMPTPTAPVQQGRVIIGQPSPAQPPISQPTAPIQAPVSVVQHYPNFEAWRQDFVQRASQRYGRDSVFALMSQASFNQQVVNLDRSQAEFAKMPWEYLDSAVSASRISQGQQKRREQLALMDRNEATYGVPASIVTAIWGLESSYGAGMGTTNLVGALSTLAYDGRRREFAEAQLYAMMDMVARGDISLAQLKGSHAGGMGHTQFIPATWLVQGVDGNGDGKTSPFSLADALTSTANYLANAGWVRGLSAFYEVRLPAQFDYREIGNRLPLEVWRQMGLVSVDEPFGGSEYAELWLPAGIHGPALLTTKNFDVIKVYNNSSSYALAVATLARRINGRVGIQANFPRHERPLSRAQIERLQHNLTMQGYDTKGIDGVAGANTRKAFAYWQLAHGQIPDGFISQRSAQSLVY